MPVVTGHALQYEEYVRPEELSGVRTRTYPRMAAQTHTHLHVDARYSHTHILLKPTVAKQE